MSQQVLTDIKVLEFSEFVAGPYCGRLPAGLGMKPFCIYNSSKGIYNPTKVSSKRNNYLSGKFLNMVRRQIEILTEE